MCRTEIPETQIWLQRPECGWVLGKKRTLVRVIERLFVCLKVDKHVVCKVTVNSFSIKPNHCLSLTLIKFCECLNPTIKKFNNAAVKVDLLKQDQIF